MTIDQATLARRLKEAREESGLTQAEVAQAVRLSRTALAQIEGANRSVSSLELAELAQFYGRKTDSFFRGEPDTSSEAPVHTVFRAGAGIEDDPTAREEVTDAVRLCEEGALLEQLLGRRPRSGPPAYDLAIPDRKFDAVEQGFRVASEERKRLEFGDAPIPDMADLISSQEIWASGAKFCNEISGVFFDHPSVGMVILVNYDHVRARKRFSYAHEYAHALLDRREGVTVSRFQNRGDMREVRANAFAAAFLMPRRGVLSALRSLNKGIPSRTHTWIYDQATESEGSPAIQAEDRTTPGSQTITYRDVASLAFHFGVSYKATAYRVRNLNVVNQKECESLIAQEELGREYLHVLNLEDFEEKDPVPDREFRSHIAYLAIEAYRREFVSRGRLLELSKLLGIGGEQLLRLAKATV